MKYKRWMLLYIGLFIAALLACGGREVVTPGAPTETPPPAIAQPTPTPSPTPTPAASDPKTGVASLEIINDSGQDVWYVYISPSDADEWGEDWTGDDIIANGDRHLIPNIPRGVYDVKAANAAGDALDIWWETTIEGAMQWTLAPVAGVEIWNYSDQEITTLYIADFESDSWGANWLDGATIPPGESYQITNITPGVYDLRVINPDNLSIESIYNVDLAHEYIWSVIGKTNLPVSAVLRFEDDFSDNRNNWGNPVADDEVHYIPPADGEYCILIKSANLTAWEWYEPFRPNEFIAEVACEIPEGEASCGLGFGPDGDNLFWFEVSPYDQTFALFLLQDDVWQDALISWTESKHIVPEGRNYLSLERVQGVVSVFVNSILLDEVETDLFPNGRVGIGGATYDQENVLICLDNLKVWRIE